MGRRSKSDVHGVLLVDKPRGPTSHDVVAWARRTLGTRAIGHAGTLDPMATGLLVLAVGEATKIVRWLTDDDKHYRATLSLGEETDTLDALGEVVERAPVPVIDEETLSALAARMIGPGVQTPPAYSAIKVDGERLHRRARRGEVVDVPEREVHIESLALHLEDSATISIEVRAAKGFYVRSLGRDVARALGTVGHLSALRRLGSGPFTVDDAIDGSVLEQARAGDEEARARVRGSLLTIRRAAVGMAEVVLDAEGVLDAQHGRPISLSRVVSGLEAAAEASPILLLDHDAIPIAIGERTADGLRVLRGLPGAKSPG